MMQVMFSKQQIEEVVQASLAELAVDLDQADLAAVTSETILFGPEGSLDSLALVHLIADVETRIAEEFERDLIIADDRAMSRSRSPFRTVETFSAYLSELLKEEES